MHISNSQLLLNFNADYGHLKKSYEKNRAATEALQYFLEQIKESIERYNHTFYAAEKIKFLMFTLETQSNEDLKDLSDFLLSLEKQLAIQQEFIDRSYHLAAFKARSLLSEISLSNMELSHLSEKICYFYQNFKECHALNSR